jgi:hypothetical protein
LILLISNGLIIVNSFEDECATGSAQHTKCVRNLKNLQFIAFVKLHCHIHWLYSL